MSSTDVLIRSDLRWCYLQQTVHFSSQIRTPSFSINWPSLVSTGRSPIILWRLWPHKPSRKHDSNKYQSKACVICDHESDETRSVTHVNKAYLVWLIRVLSTTVLNTIRTAPIRSCVRGRMQFFKIVGFAGKRFLLSPPPPPSFIFFGCCPSFLNEPREETLATQARLD